MKQRIITGVVALALFLPIAILLGETSFRVFIALVSAISAFELLQCIGCIKKPLLSVPLVAFSFAMPLLYRLPDKYRLVIFVFVMFYCMSTLVFSDGKISAQEACVGFTGVFFCTLSYECIAVLREMYSWAFFLVFVASWGSDTFAYFGGRALGKHKLIPNISPKKTVEGAIAGALGGGILFPVFGLIFASTTGFSVDYLLLSLIGLLAAVVSQIGDLIMSAIKRCYGIKDFGQILPGHGGILDRFDSTLTVAPLLCLAFSVFRIIYV